MTYKVKDGARDKGQKYETNKDEESNLMVIEFAEIIIGLKTQKNQKHRNSVILLAEYHAKLWLPLRASYELWYASHSYDWLRQV